MTLPRESAMLAQRQDDCYHCKHPARHLVLSCQTRYADTIGRLSEMRSRVLAQARFEHRITADNDAVFHHPLGLSAAPGAEAPLAAAAKEAVGMADQATSSGKLAEDAPPGPRARVLYEVSVLGAASRNQTWRTGIYRVVEELGRALQASGRCQIRFCVLDNVEKRLLAEVWLKTQPELAHLKLEPELFQSTINDWFPCCFPSSSTRTQPAGSWNGSSIIRHPGSGSLPIRSPLRTTSAISPRAWIRSVSSSPRWQPASTSGLAAIGQEWRLYGSSITFRRSLSS
jgi:hypothetical protein